MPSNRRPTAQEACEGFLEFAKRLTTSSAQEPCGLSECAEHMEKPTAQKRHVDRFLGFAERPNFQPPQTLRSHVCWLLRQQQLEQTLDVSMLQAVEKSLSAPGSRLSTSPSRRSWNIVNRSMPII